MTLTKLVIIEFSKSHPVQIMQIAILTSGSRGDVQPFIALGVGLRGAGYQVRLLVKPSSEKFNHE
jgi:UDP:flavonoid glycosyltransferase YjiC (YdhE family)